MKPKDYYYKRFRHQFDEWLLKTSAHQHGEASLFISIQELSPNNLSHIPKEEVDLFLYALTCTVLIDQVMYTYFKVDYPKFQELTRYPKMEYGITNINVSPWDILRGSGLKGLEEFLIFFINDLKEFYSEHVFKKASWENVKRAMLEDEDCTQGPSGEILKKLLSEESGSEKISRYLPGYESSQSRHL